MPIDEETPLLWNEDNSYRRRSSEYERPRHYHDGGQLKHTDVLGKHPHAQFCALTGCPPSNAGPKDKIIIPKKSLYGRAIAELKSQRRSYNASAAISNLLLLSQVILGAAITALGASASSHILITVFGALNTVIAGLISYWKSRGQPMRARMYRDDLDRVVDEIENSEVMWRGISEGAHGYDEIDTDEVTVRSEVARLTRLLERAIRLNSMNNPDMYMAGGSMSDGAQGGARPSRGPGAAPSGPQDAAVPNVVDSGAPQPSAENAGAAVSLSNNPDDDSPATKADVKDDKKKPAPKSDGDTKGKKPATDGGASDDDEPAAEVSPPEKAATDTNAEPVAPKAKDDAKSSQSSQSNEPPSTTQAPPQATSALPLTNDPDASPATNPKLKPKQTKSDNGPPASTDTKEVAGDDST